MNNTRMPFRIRCLQTQVCNMLCGFEQIMYLISSKSVDHTEKSIWLVQMRRWVRASCYWVVHGAPRSMERCLYSMWMELKVQIPQWFKVFIKLSFVCRVAELVEIMKLGKWMWGALPKGYSTCPEYQTLEAASEVGIGCLLQPRARRGHVFIIGRSGHAMARSPITGILCLISNQEYTHQNNCLTLRLHIFLFWSNYYDLQAKPFQDIAVWKNTSQYLTKLNLVSCCLQRWRSLSKEIPMWKMVLSPKLTSAPIPRLSGPN